MILRYVIQIRELAKLYIKSRSGIYVPRISYLPFIILLISSNLLFAQKKSFYIDWNWIDSTRITEKINTKSVRDSAEFVLWIDEIQNKYFEKGYISFSIDSAYITKDSAYIIAFQGDQYLIRDIRFTGDYNFFISPGDFKSARYFEEKQIEYIKNKIISKATSQGYPFTTVEVKSVFSGDSNADVVLNIDVRKGTLIYFSKVVINEDSPVSVNYVRKYLGIKKDGVFNAEIIENAYRRLDELPFITVNDSSLLYFEDNQAVLDLKLIGKNASNFDILLGLQPSDDISTGTRKFVMTGNVNVNLHNQLKKGEFFGFKYRSPGNTSQELKLQLIYPYILNMPFGIESQFELFKRDSSFTDVKYDIGLNYIFKGVNSIKVFIENERSNLLNINESQILSTRRLPQNLDYSYIQYGTGLHMEKLNYRFNPRSGWLMNMSIGLGQRKILKNAIILNLESPDFNPESLYSDIKTDIIKMNTTIQLEYYIPIGRAAVFLFRNRSALQITDLFGPDNKSGLIQNELFRVGGIYSLRGFDEDTYFANGYSIFTGEARLITGRNSNFFAFFDYGFLSTLVHESTLKAYGTGVGLNAETKVGIFSIAYAIGSSSDQELNFRNGKIHFGYQALF